MSVGRPNPDIIIGEDVYRQNQADIQEAQALVDAWRARNEQGKRMYDMYQDELARKIKEGEEAKRILQDMERVAQNRPPAVAAHVSRSSAPLAITHAPTSAREGRHIGHDQRVQAPSMVQVTQPYTNWTVYGQSSNFAIPPHHTTQYNAPAEQTNGAQQDPASSVYRPTPNSQPQSPQPKPASRQQRTQPAHPQQPAYQAASSPPPVQQPRQQRPIPATQNAEGRVPHPQVQAPPQPVPAQTSALTFVPSHYRPHYVSTPPAASSSSLSGALGPVPSTVSVPPVQMSGTQPQIQPPSTQVSAPIERSKPRKARSKLRLSNQPTTGSLGTVASSSQTSQLAPPSNTSRLPGAEIILRNLEDITRKIAIWAASAPPNSFLTIPGSVFKVYKDAGHQTSLIVSDNAGGYVSFMHLVVTNSIPPPELGYYRDETGKSYYLTKAPTKQAKKYRFAPSSFITNGTQASGSTVAPSTANFRVRPPTITRGGLPRTPGDANVKHLARDILRALGRPYGMKRSRPDQETRSDAGIERPAKIHILDAGAVDNQLTDPNPGLPPQTPSIMFSAGSSQAPPIIPSAQDLTAVVTVPISGPPNISAMGTAPSLVVESDVGRNTSVGNQLAHRSPSVADAAPTSPPVTPTPPAPPPPQAETPLFLTSSPSPSASPAGPGRGGVSSQDADTVMDNELSYPTKNIIEGGSSAGLASATRAIKGGKRKAGQQVYVLVPPPPEYVKRFKAQEAKGKVKGWYAGGHIRKKGHRAGKEESEKTESKRASGSRTTSEDLKYPSQAGDIEFHDNTEEKIARLSWSRLSERPCKWNGCDVVMNSAGRLLDHFVEHRQENYHKHPVSCQWQQCGRQFNKGETLFDHLKSHALSPLVCMYEGCKESFRTPRQLVRHTQGRHGDGVLRPSPAPARPGVILVPMTPDVLPSYMIEARAVQQPSISRERHTTLGQWVLRNISGPVDLGAKRYNAATTLRIFRGDDASERGRPGHQEYEFLTSTTTQYSSMPSRPARVRNMEDLDSGHVSRLVHDGLVLWCAPDETVTHEPTDGDGGVVIKEEGPTGVRLGIEPQINSDEEAVALMLTQT